MAIVWLLVVMLYSKLKKKSPRKGRRSRARITPISSSIKESCRSRIWRIGCIFPLSYWVFVFGCYENDLDCMRLLGNLDRLYP